MGGGAAVWALFMKVFDVLPLAAIVDNRIFAVHGGLSPALSTVESVGALFRMQEVPDEGPLADLLWSDPQDLNGWLRNRRGSGWEFGPDVARQFLYVNGLSLIARAHQLVMEGYRFSATNRVVTVWSAPNYCDRFNNRACVMQVAPGGSANFAFFKEAAEVAGKGGDAAAQRERAAITDSVNRKYFSEDPG